MSQRMQAGWWIMVGLVLVALGLPVVIADGNAWGWTALGGGFALVGVSILALVRGWTIFTTNGRH